MSWQDSPFVQTKTAPGVINLGLGQPSPSLLPLAEIGAAACEQLGQGRDPLVLQYGAMLGYEQFRVALAGFLSREYAMTVSADDLLVTGGISTALSLVCDVFAEPGATVVCEDPTYFHARNIFASAGLELRGLPVDGEGLRVELLAAELEAGLRPAFVYCIPVFQNPCGVSLSAGRARALIELAERFDFTIVADEPYASLYYGKERPGSLLRHDRGRGRVLSLGSFSKILAPGLRLGWAHGAQPLISRLAQHGAIRSGGCLNPVIANIVHHTLDSGFLDRHVAELRRVLGERSRALSASIRAHLPTATFTRPAGGYFCWLELGEGVDSSALLERPAQVAFIPGSRCAISADLSRFVRLSFAFYERDELEEGVRRLAGLV